MPICPACRVGFAASNLVRTSCQVSAFWPKPLSMRVTTRNIHKHKRFKGPCMNPPCYLAEWVWPATALRRVCSTTKTEFSSRTSGGRQSNRMAKKQEKVDRTEVTLLTLQNGYNPP